MKRTHGARVGVLRVAIAIAAVAGAGCASDEPEVGSHYFPDGDCDPPPGSTPLAVEARSFMDTGCVDHWATGMVVVESIEDWNAAFFCEPQLPDWLDLAVERAAVVWAGCEVMQSRFTAETATEVIVGTYQVGGGACIDWPLVVALPRSAKPVRQARCWQACEGECPPAARLSMP